jgi:hypothetical protein
MASKALAVVVISSTVQNNNVERIGMALAGGSRVKRSDSAAVRRCA